MGSSESNISSRKSTAVSSTTRIGSSGQGSTKMGRSGIDLLENFDGRGVIELSLAKPKKKPPHKLKPLAQKANDKLDDLLGDYETTEGKQMLRQLEDDMKDYLDQGQILN